MVRGRGIAVTAVALVYQCAEITRIACGRGTDRPNSRQASVYLLGRIACIGLPCPMKAAGIRPSVVVFTGTSGAGEGDQLELDVVGVAEVQRPAPPVLGDRAVGDAPRLELGDPLVQRLAVGHGEADVVEPGADGVERLAGVGGVFVHDDEHRPVLGAQDDGVATVAAVVLLAGELLEAEQVAVPGDALLDVRDGQRDVVKGGGHLGSPRASVEPWWLRDTPTVPSDTAPPHGGGPTSSSRVRRSMSVCPASRRTPCGDRGQSAAVSRAASATSSERDRDRKST